ncbi:type I-F CRISPR-associated endoribonuclease Cas6/Csy4 [Stagnimonas aquatica]|uniref:Type I-F CRISPR-associated endoribonuclease Cas6/Csy4 n=1 Tax=Stagnimonas aquatica TaxID=2689987 RepID=A0A3N0V4R2_9GAMM|nr:type I-F CRISPR-associated endoribonuclease Cas6/Csy4 [Stagnimonas aquatica]ROH87787.1 type I-F CRISPR-associated endoribonuclease Cas6/Csy4 [Stagnimonas aquatica]
MDHYLDIRLRPDPDFVAIDLLSALVSKLHRALARLADGKVGISFPDSKAMYLGDRLRLHGGLSSLQSLMGSDWLKGMRDHVQLSEPVAVPVGAKHRVVKRVQAKSSPERLRRRQIKRHGMTPQQAQEKVPDSAAETLSLPYLLLRSASTGQRFPLFVEHGPLLEAAVPGSFSSYGLSDVATVPWF